MITAKKPNTNDMIKLDVRIIAPIFVKPDWGVYEVEVLNSNEVYNNSFDYILEHAYITGNFEKKFFFNEEYIMYGVKTHHPKYGEQFRIFVVNDKIDTPERVRAFLLQFCAESIVNQLIDKYGGEVLQRILNNEIDYSDIKGMGDYRFQALQDKVKENEYMKDIIYHLGKYSITPLQMKKIVKKFGANAIDKINDNPYCLCQISGITFPKADDIAQQMGYDMASPNRICECIKYLIGEEEKNGHTWIDKKHLMNEVSTMLSLKLSLINEAFNHLNEDEVLVFDNKVCLTKTYIAEKIICERLMQIASVNEPITIDIDAFLEEKEKEYGITLTEEQRNFFYSFQQNNVNILVGYAGTGKSQMQKFVIELLDRLQMSYCLLAPTGKASKVMEQYTNRPTFTIHRKLGLFSGDDQNEFNSIFDDVVIVDECSMVDVHVCSKLLQALDNPNVRLLLIGDDFQIPSVGVGNFFHDIIESNALPVSKLTQVFRQKEGGILDIATKVRLKEGFIQNDYVGQKYFGKDAIIHCVSSAYMADGYIYYYKNALEKYSPDEIIILSPTKKGKLGTHEINKTIQALVNPSSPDKVEVEYGKDTIFREGDRVINIKNNYHALTVYDKETVVYNGDMGIITKIDLEHQFVLIDYGFSVVKTYFTNMDTFIHSYALTFHKCLDENTWLLTDKGLMQIKDLNNNALVGQFKPLNNNINVFNGNELEKPSSFYNNGLDLCYNFKTKRNYSLSATADHRVNVLGSSGFIEEKLAKDIEIGDYLVLHRNSNVFGNNIDLPMSWQNRNDFDVRTVIYKRPTKMTKEFARFLGYMVADGTIYKNGIRYTNRYEENTLDFKNIINTLFNYNNGSVCFRKSGDYMYEVSSVDIADFCKNIEGIQPNNKFVPNCILQAPKEFQVEFLKAVFEDGAVSVKNNIFDHIELSMKNELMCDQIRMMLLNMGIISTKYKTKSSLYNLYIYKNDAKIFADNIGFISNFKNNRLRLCYEDRGKCCSRYSFPWVNQILKSLIKKYNISSIGHSMVSALCKKNITLRTINIFIDKYYDILKDDQNFQYLIKVRDNYIFEKIVDISTEYKQTYCLEMPESHKFIQNGFHAFNSQGSGYQCVILITDKAHKWQLNANLLYTGITRTKDFMVQLCQADVINTAMKKNVNLERNTFLKDLLQDVNKEVV